MRKIASQLQRVITFNALMMITHQCCRIGTHKKVRVPVHSNRCPNEIDENEGQKEASFGLVPGGGGFGMLNFRDLSPPFSMVSSTSVIYMQIWLLKRILVEANLIGNGHRWVCVHKPGNAMLLLNQSTLV